MGLEVSLRVTLGTKGTAVHYFDGTTFELLRQAGFQCGVFGVEVESDEEVSPIILLNPDTGNTWLLQKLSRMPALDGACSVFSSHRLFLN
jgi:hypothetical protein